MTRALLVPILLLCGLSAFSQSKGRKPEPSTTAKGTLVLPSDLGQGVFKDVTETIGQFDLVVQQPLYKGLGIGLGAKGTYFLLKEGSLAPAVTQGDVTRWTYYGKVQYEHYTGPATYYEFAARFGQSNYRWNSTTNPELEKESGFHWGISAAYYLHATDNLAFGLMIGYESDAAQIYPQLLGLESYPGYKDSSPQGPLDFLNVGIGFSTRFRKAEDRPMNYE